MQRRLILAIIGLLMLTLSMTAVGFADEIEVITTTEGGITQILTTFEGNGHGQPIYPADGGLIPGSSMIFPSWHTLTSGFANNPSGATVAYFNSDFGEIYFDVPVYSVGLFYSSAIDVTLEAFNSDGQVVSTTFGEENLLPSYPYFGQWDFLGVSVGADVITRVRIVGGTVMTGIDDFSIRYGINPIPEPATMFLLGSGLVGLAGFRRKTREQS